MLILAATTDKLQLTTGQAVTVDVHVSYVDLNTSTSAVTPGKQNTAITTATTTDILAAPASGSIRNAKTINIRNKHASNSVDVTVIFDQNATDFELHKVTLRAGEALEYVEGVGWYLLAVGITPQLMKALSADETAQNVNTVQPWFPTLGAVTVEANSTYEINGLLVLNRSAGTTSHTTSLLFGGTATLTSIQYLASVKSGDVEANAAQNATISRVATATVVKAASTSATEAISIKVDGLIRINAAGTLIPQFQYSATPGGAPTVKANSYFRLDYRGTGTVTTIGTWS